VRTATLTRAPRGPSPLPRRRINQPAFYDAVRGCGIPSFQIAINAGIAHQTAFSKLILAESVPDTELQVNRLERIAEIVGFDRDQLFVGGDR
jgi:hypothetical protein